ncbi:hypothetical protein BYT27DRAFT_6703456 [Phlegmacium glaucopus]|nr:hypothetical protein BYT27DRAFT_6703456 [Phlegmacium glaucopus]
MTQLFLFNYILLIPIENRGVNFSEFFSDVLLLNVVPSDNNSIQVDGSQAFVQVMDILSFHSDTRLFYGSILLLPEGALYGF